MNRLQLVGGLCAIALAAGGALGVTITFSEVPAGTNVNGMVIGNVTFSFSQGGNPANTAAVGAAGPGNTTYIQAPNVEGPADGVLRMAFAVPVQSISYGFAVNVGTPNPFANASSIEVFAPGGASLGTVNTDGSHLQNQLFLEGLGSVSGLGAIGSARVYFNAALPSGTRFAFDNLTLDGPTIPLPTASAMGLVGLAAVGTRRRR